MDNSYVLEIDDPLVQHGIGVCIGSTGENLDLTHLTNCTRCKRIIFCSGSKTLGVTYHQCEQCLIDECEESC